MKGPFFVFCILACAALSGGTSDAPCPCGNPSEIPGSSEVFGFDIPNPGNVTFVSLQGFGEPFASSCWKSLDVAFFSDCTGDESLQVLIDVYLFNPLVPDTAESVYSVALASVSAPGVFSTRIPLGDRVTCDGDSIGMNLEIGNVLCTSGSYVNFVANPTYSTSCIDHTTRSQGMELELASFSGAERVDVGYQGPSFETCNELFLAGEFQIVGPASPTVDFSLYLPAYRDPPGAALVCDATCLDSPTGREAACSAIGSKDAIEISVSDPGNATNPCTNLLVEAAYRISPIGLNPFCPQSTLPGGRTVASAYAPPAIRPKRRSRVRRGGR